MSVDTQQYFRPNHYATILAMCGDDEACAQKYEFTFQNDLADYMNPVERISISSSELEVGYYVVGVRAHTLTESDTQAYGVAAAGGGLVLHDMSESWSDLGLETQSTGGGGQGSEPNPDGDLAGATPAPIGTVLGTFTPTAADSSSSARDTILAVTPAPVQGVESATSSSEEASSDGAPTSAGDGSRESTISSTSEPSGIGVSYVGGDGDSGEVADTDLTTADGGGGGGLSFESKIATAASVAGAFLLIGVGICLAVRRSKVRSARDDDTGSFLCPPRHAQSSGRAVVGDAEGPADIYGLQQGEEGRGGDGRHDSRDGEEEVGLYELPLGGASLPGYATAVASMPEEEGHTIIVGPSGVEQGVKLTAADESEVSDFYSAVDSGAVETLVSWGISRDFARVALRRTDNDVQDGLRIIAEGNMDYLLAMDHEQ